MMVQQIRFSSHVTSSFCKFFDIIIFFCNIIIP